jgi:hypothetical protein
VSEAMIRQYRHNEKLLTPTYNRLFLFLMARCRSGGLGEEGARGMCRRVCQKHVHGELMPTLRHGVFFANSTDQMDLSGFHIGAAIQASACQAHMGPRANVCACGRQLAMSGAST